MIEQLGQMLIRLRKVITGRTGTPEAIRQEMRAVAAAGNVDLEIARVATPETLLMLVAPSGEVEPTRCWLYAELLHLDGLDAAADHRYDEARLSFDKAIRLFDLLGPGGVNLVGWPDADERIHEIRTVLASLESKTEDGGDGRG